MSPDECVGIGVEALQRGLGAMDREQKTYGLSEKSDGTRLAANQNHCSLNPALFSHAL